MRYVGTTCVYCQCIMLFRAALWLYYEPTAMLLMPSKSLAVMLTPIRVDDATGLTFNSAATIVYSPVGEWLQVRLFMYERSIAL